MIYRDAHNHLHDARLAPFRETVLADIEQIGVRGMVVDGTREEDWPEVARLAAAHAWITPSFGLHPWHVATRSPGWLHTLRHLLDAHPAAGVGEIGLDRWIEGHDLAVQTEIFTAQLALAAERNLPATIHCLRAWGALWEILRTHPLPARGFLLHAYGGPAEMIDGFVKQGAYFSFNAYFLHARKAAQRETFRRIPIERLLIETDAPDMLPPSESNRHPLPDAAINHPANIEAAYASLAELRGIALPELAAHAAENYARLFGDAAQAVRHASSSPRM